MASQEEKDRPSNPKGEEGASTGPSKSALKKAAKEKEKAEKAAKRLEQERQEKEKSEANDNAKHLYGHYNLLPEQRDAEDSKTAAQRIKLRGLDETWEGKEVTVCARVHNARVQSAKLAFLDLRQRTENIQAVISEGGENQISRQMVKWCGGLNRESIVLVTGLAKKPKDPIHSATISNLEIHVTKVYLIAEGPVQLPMQVKDAMRPPPIGEEAELEDQVDSQGTPIVSLKTRLDNRVLDLRTPTNQAIFGIQSGVELLFREYCQNHGFQAIQSTKIAGAATEGGSGVFEVKYFDKQAYLTQSPQFYKQMAIAGDMERVYEVGPVFRAENSNTNRHLTEFTGLDFEMEIQEHYHEVMDFGEDLLIFIFRELKRRYAYEIKVIEREYPDAGNFQIPEGRCPRITFAEGIAMLREAGEEVSDYDDLTTPQEKHLGALIRAQHHTDFYSLDKFPLSIRPFYTHPCPLNPALSNSYDFFMRGQEILSGAQRIHSPARLVDAMRDKGLDPRDDGYRHYLDAFRYGCAPHGGGGLGLNRIVQFFLGVGNVRLCTLFPRDPGRRAP